MLTGNTRFRPRRTIMGARFLIVEVEERQTTYMKDGNYEFKYVWRPATEDDLQDEQTVTV
jgi:hypothetical protein